MTRRLVRQPITPEALAPLIERHGARWKIWRSAHGAYACATLRRGLSWVCTQGRVPVGAGGAYVRSLVTDSPEQFQEAIDEENRIIAALLADGTLKADS